MNGTMKLVGMMNFKLLGGKGWGSLEYIGGALFIEPSDVPKFSGTGYIKEVELGIELTSFGGATGFKVKSVLNVSYAK